MEKPTALLNRYLFTQIGLDSGALTSLGVVMHTFPQPGLYRGVVLRGEDSVGSFLLEVAEDSPQTQVDIDLAKVKAPAAEPCCDEASRAPYVVSPRGYAVFHVSSGPGGFSVVVGRGDPRKPEVLFDSRELLEGDLFAATILRPGSYTVSNVLARGQARAELVVAYPQPAKERYAQPPVHTVTLTAKGFEPERMRVAAAQSQVYHIKGRARIRIALEKPDDGPLGPGRTHPGWHQPDVTEPPAPGKETDTPQQATRKASTPEQTKRTASRPRRARKSVR